MIRPALSGIFATLAAYLLLERHRAWSAAFVLLNSGIWWYLGWKFRELERLEAFELGRHYELETFLKEFKAGS